MVDTANIESFEFANSRARQFGNHPGTHVVERTMIPCCTNPDQGRLCCLGRRGFIDLAKPLEGDSHIVRHRLEVSVDVLGWLISSQSTWLFGTRFFRQA